MTKKISPISTLLNRIGVQSKPVLPTYRPLPGQSAKDHANEMRELAQKRLQPELPVYRALPGQSAEDHGREMQQLMRKRSQRLLPSQK